jgi:hypothetical protein
VTPTANPGDLVRLNAPGSAEVRGSDGRPLLHVQLVGVELGNAHPLAQFGVTCEPSLVLANAAASYSRSELQALRSYISTTVSLGFIDFPLPDTKAPPSLQWVSGSSYACGGELEVTNLSGHVVQVDRIGAQLAAAATVNRYQYRLIDVCTIAPSRYAGCRGEVGGEPPCTLEADLHLALAAPGTVFGAPITTTFPDDPQCPPQHTVYPGQTLAIDLVFSPPAGQYGRLYRVTPQLRVTDDTTHDLVLSSLTTTLAFASPNQFSCYGLQATHFVRLPDVPSQQGDRSFCV